MLSGSLVYFAYGVAALVALGVYVGLPKDGRCGRWGWVLLAITAALGGVAVLLNRLLGLGAGHLPFYVLSVLAIGGAIRVVTHPRPVFSALFFIMVVLSTAGLIILVGAEFLGMALVIVYAGAVLVTYVFVIMLSQQSSTTDGRSASVLNYDRSARRPVWTSLAGFVLMATLVGVIVERDWRSWDEAAAEAMAEQNTLAVGRMLMTDYAISVELAGVLLMVAMIGAIAVARKRLPRGGGDSAGLPPGEIGKRVPPY